MLKRAILQALEDKYQAQISEADATIKIYLDLAEFKSFWENFGGNEC